MAVVRKGVLGVTLPSVGPDRGAGRHILSEEMSDRLPVGVRCDCQTDPAGSLGGPSALVNVADHLDRSENECLGLRRRHAPAELALNGASHNRFVGFNVARQPGSRVTEKRGRILTLDIRKLRSVFTV